MRMRRRVALGCLIVLTTCVAVAVAGCGGGNASAKRAPRAGVTPKLAPPNCPDRHASASRRLAAIANLSSTRVAGGPLAAGGVQWTTICSVGSRVLVGGPLDRLLNSARPYTDQICPTDAVAPILVILRYAHATRRFVVDMGGCPGVRLADGSELIFAGSALVKAEPALMRAAFSSTPHAAITTPQPNLVAFKPPAGLSQSQRSAFLGGEAVLGQTGCEACHMIGSYGNNGPGPPLTHIGTLRSSAAISASLRNPTAPMPSFANLARAEPKKFHDLIEFLSLLK